MDLYPLIIKNDTIKNRPIVKLYVVANYFFIFLSYIIKNKIITNEKIITYPCPCNCHCVL